MSLNLDFPDSKIFRDKNEGMIGVDEVKKYTGLNIVTEVIMKLNI